MRILVVSWAWPPIGRVGALRPLRMAEHWHRHGHSVDVLTGPGDRGGEYAPDLLDRAHRSGATVHRSAAPGIPKPAELLAATAHAPEASIARTRVPRLRQILGQWRSFPDGQRSWISPAVAAARQLHRTRPFDVVWTTSPPESVHFVGMRLAQTLALPWVADFRDQWADYPLARWDPLSRRLIDRITRWVLRDAAAVTAVGEGYASSIQRAIGRGVATVLNGFDPVPRRVGTPLPSTLGYFGRVDPDWQEPGRLWPALREVHSRGQRWRVEFYLSPGGGGGRRLISPPDLAAFVEVKRPLPHPEAIQRMQAMTGLLTLPFETVGGEANLAGKLYDYVGARRPVLVIAPPTFAARLLIESTGTGVGAWTTEEIAAALGRLPLFQPSRKGRSRLSVFESAGQMLEILRSVTRGEDLR